MQYWTLTNDGPYTELHLHRPPVNAVGSEALDEFIALLQELEAIKRWRCLVLTGGCLSPGGERCFCAGADLKERRAWSKEQIIVHVHKQRLALQRFSELCVYKIALVGGHALGLGTELCLCCNYVFATRRAMFGFPETRRGIIPGAGGSAWLMQKQDRMAWKLALSGRSFDVSTAQRLGIVDECCDTESDARAQIKALMAELEESTDEAKYALMHANAEYLRACSAVKIEQEAYDRLLMGYLKYGERRK